MTYCVGVKLDAGLVFLSDSRTNAGLDQISTFRKMMIYEQPGDRFMVMLSAGNLSISQQVREILQIEELANDDGPPITIWNATSMFDAARVLGAAMRRVYDQDGDALKKSGLDFNATMIFGGQIKGEAMRLFLVYSAGNFIEATRETCFFQIGESKYGKPVLDRMMRPATPLDEAAKCVLVSMDSTLKSNLSVGLPLDLVVYEVDQLQSTQVVCIDDRNPYFQMIRNTWGEKLRQIFESIDDPQWDGGAATAPLCVPSGATRRWRRSPTRAKSWSERAPRRAATAVGTHGKRTPIIALYHHGIAHDASAVRNDQVRLRHRRRGVLAGQGHRFCVPRRDPRIAGPQSHPDKAGSVPQRRSGDDVAVPARRGVRHRRRRRDRPRSRPLRALHHDADEDARTTSRPARSTRACSRRSAAATTSARRCR